MAFFKKILLGVVIILTLAFLTNWGLNLWLNNQLPKIISEKNKSPYYIKYKDLDISIWSGTIKATDVIILPKNAVKETIDKAGDLL